MQKKSLKTASATLAALILLSGCQTAAERAQLPSTPAPKVIKHEPRTVAQCPPNTSTMISKQDLEFQTALPKKGDTIAVMDTDFGTIKFKLFTKEIPTLTKNFIELAKAGKYTATPFHRVMQNFMIQGGDFTNKNGTGGHSYKGPGTVLANEINPRLHHLYGAVSMAKTSAPVSIGSQFFIVNNKECGALFLDGDYSPFAQVYEGMDVVHKITDLQVAGTQEPSEQVLVKTVTIEVVK